MNVSITIKRLKDGTINWECTVQDDSSETALQKSQDIEKELQQRYPIWKKYDD